MSYSTNKAKSHMLVTSKNFYVSRFYEEKNLAPENGAGTGAPPDPPVSTALKCIFEIEFFKPATEFY